VTAAGEIVVGPLTVQRYATDWLEERKALDPCNAREK
jgi:hypothetical protein